MTRKVLIDRPSKRASQGSCSGRDLNPFKMLHELCEHHSTSDVSGLKCIRSPDGIAVCRVRTGWPELHRRDHKQIYYRLRTHGSNACNNCCKRPHCRTFLVALAIASTNARRNASVFLLILPSFFLRHLMRLDDLPFTGFVELYREEHISAIALTHILPVLSMHPHCQ
jgi:hypothetical protein